jgi:Ras of Complex, Roc, domain of DAPkinase/F-box-like
MRKKVTLFVDRKQECTTMKSYKLLIVGEAKTRKTWFVQRICEIFLHRFQTNSTYIPTVGVEILEAEIDLFFPKETASPGCSSQAGKEENTIKFKIWDFAGEEKNKGLEDGYCIGGDAALIFFEQNSEWFNQIHSWQKKLYKICPGIPIVAVAIDGNSRGGVACKLRNVSSKHLQRPVFVALNSLKICTWPIREIVAGLVNCSKVAVVPQTLDRKIAKNPIYSQPLHVDLNFTESSEDNPCGLPVEILYLIFNRSSVCDKIQVMKVCKLWYEIASSMVTRGELLDFHESIEEGGDCCSDSTTTLKQLDEELEQIHEEIVKHLGADEKVNF